MSKKLYNAVPSNSDIIFDDIESDIVAFFSNNIGLNSINLNNINPDDDDFDNFDPETINHVRLKAWYDRYKQRKALKKKINEKLVSVV